MHERRTGKQGWTRARAAAIALALGATGASAGLVAEQPDVPDVRVRPPTERREPATDRPLGPTAQNQAAADEMNAELDQAVNRGLQWLAQQQSPDGSFGGGRFGKNVAVTALAGIALMADGNLPGRGPYGEQVRKAIEFVLVSSTETGLIAADTTNGPMYGHGFATLFLGEVYGMTQGGGDTKLAQRVHQALVKACRLIERTQNDEGGWRYNPVPYDADISVTICQVMALRSARNAGVEVPKQVIDKAVEYVRRCQNPDGGFKYQAEQGMSAWPRSAAGVASLYYSGIYEDQALTKGVEYLLRNAMPNSINRPETHYFYGQYYTVQSMYLAGGEAWATSWPLIREELLRRQMSNGSWADPSVGPAYGSSMALIVLQMPKRYLPIFQK
ncbi:MAG: prenyltransferase/squalene oxidase repeat-containing protein [Phycisphaerales bacterium]